MNEHEVDACFAEVQRLLSGDAWERAPLFNLAHAVAEARERGDKAAETSGLCELREHIRERGAAIRAQLDDLLDAAPCTILARILYMETLTGHPQPPGGTVNVSARASMLRKALNAHLCKDRDLEEYNARLQHEGHAAAYAWDQEVGKWNTFRQNVAGREIEVEALRICMHFQEAGDRWMKRPQSGRTFADVFTSAQWASVELAMSEAGISPKEGKGKNCTIAAVHAAFRRYGKKIPKAREWLELLGNTFPSVTWNAKNVPEERPSYQNRSYRTAYNAVLNRLG